MNRLQACTDKLAKISLFKSDAKSLAIVFIPLTLIFSLKYQVLELTGMRELNLTMLASDDNRLKKTCIFH